MSRKQNNLMSILNTAIQFIRDGYSVIPVRYMDKKPIIDWKAYQKQLPSEKDVITWFSQKANLGIVTGFNNLIVLDFDETDAYLKWLTWSSKMTGITEWISHNAYRVETARGMHVYIRMEEVIKTRKVEKIDVKGAYGYVLGEGSVHPSGILYRAMREQRIIPMVTNLSDVLPAELLLQHTELSKCIQVQQIGAQSDAASNDPWEVVNKPVKASGIDEIKKMYRIESFFTEQTKTGDEYILVPCPFHDDRHPSLWIDTKRQICNCFSCNFTKPMDVLNFYARLYGLSNKESIRSLAR